MKICITGLAGFIAFHLANKLKSEGHEICGFDNYNNYYDPDLKFARSAELAKNDINVDYLSLDDGEKPLKEYMASKKPDVVVHLAAYAGVRDSLDNPDAYINTNIVGTHNLIKACEASGVNKVVYASTSCVMAGNKLPWNEADNTGYQLNPYGYSKATNECQFMTSKLDTVGLRFFTVYGPWGRPDMALFDFTKNIIANNPIELFNFGDMIRDFTYVDDIVQGIEIVANKLYETEGMNEIYNIGYGEQVKLEDFVDCIENNLERKAERSYVPMHPADTQATWSDTTKLQALGYKPTTSMKEGVEKFISWYKEYYNVN